VDENKEGLPTTLFSGRSSHTKKMQRAKEYLPTQCSNFHASVNLFSPSKKSEVVKYKFWRNKDLQIGTVARSANTTGSFADTTNIPTIFDDVTRFEFLYVNWDPVRKEWHSNSDYMIHELKEANLLLESNIYKLAQQMGLNLT